MKAEDNKKWDEDTLERRLKQYHMANDVSLFIEANNDPNMGHPLKAGKFRLPLLRFFQENKTEVFQIGCDGNTFEMFESMRIYIERNGRSYNYLDSVRKLNTKREESLLQEEKDFKANKAAESEEAAGKVEQERLGLEGLQNGRLSSIKSHMEELENTKKLNMRQFLMK